MIDPSHQDLRTLWQGQDRETDPMTLEQIHALVGKYDRRTRLSAALLAVMLVFAGFATGARLIGAHDTLDRVGVALYVLGMIVSAALIARMNFPRRDPAESAGAFLKRRLQRRLATARGGWVPILLPILPAAAVIAFWTIEHNRGPAWAPWPPLALFAVVVLFVMVRTRRQARRLEADLKELDRLMR